MRHRHLVSVITTIVNSAGPLFKNPVWPYLKKDFIFDFIFDKRLIEYSIKDIHIHIMTVTYETRKKIAKTI